MRNILIMEVGCLDVLDHLAPLLSIIASIFLLEQLIAQ